MLPSAAPMRVPSTPKNDATTAPVTAASAPASNLGTRSCSIPHLHVGVGGRRRCRGGPQARPDGSPAAPARARILPTEAVSRQVVPGQAGARAAWESCSAGYQVFIAEVLQRAEFKGAQGPEGPKVAHDEPAHVGPRRVHQYKRGCALSARRAEILLGGQESCSSMRACRARWLSRDDARAVLSNALTNSRQIQHGKHPPGWCRLTSSGPTVVSPASMRADTAPNHPIRVRTAHPGWAHAGRQRAGWAKGARSWRTPSGSRTPPRPTATAIRWHTTAKRSPTAWRARWHDGCCRPNRSVQHRRAGPGEDGKGNHFAAWQEPNLFTTEVRAAFRSLR